MRTLVSMGVLLTGCAGFEGPTAEVISLVRARPAPPGPYVRLRARLDLETPWLSGTFEGAVAACTGARPAVRMQCFPDLGGKVMDVLATPDRVAGYFPQAHEGVDAPLGPEAPFSPFTLMAVSLLEELAPLAEDRVLGQRAENDGWWLRVRPVARGARARVFLDAQGRVTRRRFTWPGGPSWEEAVDPGRSIAIEAPGFRMRVEILESRATDGFLPGLLELRLSAGVRPLRRSGLP